MIEVTPLAPVAYFCAEFGLESHLPLYAGGLGVLAGDTLKAAADLGVHCIGVGLLYRGERAKQTIDQHGMQVEVDAHFDPLSSGLEHVYIDDQPLFIKVQLTEIYVWTRVWKKHISDTVTLYLLDTDTDQNQLSERSITHALYAGTEESLLKQQLILGIGGVKVLDALGVHPSVYHINEGRPAFLFWQLARRYYATHGGTAKQAMELARSKIVYTNHTLVAAGNNTVPLDLLRRYARYYAEKLEIDVEELLLAGKKPEDTTRFYMTEFALNCSRKASGVSEPHTKLSQQAWPNFTWVNVTNGVHLPTWQDERIAKDSLRTDSLWQLHLDNKKRLADFVFHRTGFRISSDMMTITWARRLAGYKRYDALFTDVSRLKALLSRTDRPVQLLVAGKAHVSDTQGKLTLQRLIRLMANELGGSALFIPDYDLDVARHLVRGSDLWINIPERGKEACGTSGMKAAANGVLNCTVPDGWADEVDWYGKGWPLDSDNIVADVFQKLEEHIVPLYYERNDQGVPYHWLNMMKESIRLAQKYSATRMMQEYIDVLYADE